MDGIYIANSAAMLTVHQLLVFYNSKSSSTCRDVRVIQFLLGCLALGVRDDEMVLLLTFSKLVCLSSSDFCLDSIVSIRELILSNWPPRVLNCFCYVIRIITRHLIEVAPAYGGSRGCSYCNE